MAISLIKEEEHILKILPRLLKRDDRFRHEVSIILSEAFATRGELKQILEEIQKSREETNRRFEESREETNRRFEESDRRFDLQIKELQAFRKETAERFAAMDKRFDAMDKRFEDQKDWVARVVGGLQGRAGRNLEDVIAGTLRVALNRRDIRPENIIMRKKFLDDEGKIGPVGRDYEIDIYAHNSESIIFEVKSYAEPEDVVRFNDKAELVKEKLNLPSPSKILITLQKGREMVELCRRLGVELV
ncbi:MAG: hypothetical protein AB1797_04195 [bacterium]